MYSGQEIVSQEECKIILAEFYEGVECYNETDKSIKFVLVDWATATYDPVTFTLETRNFSCRPVIIEEELRITFEATMPEGTTGLEVHMHTAEYERTRIMPLIYLPICNISSWDINYGNYNWAYVEKFCNESTYTLVEVKGEVDSVTPTSINLVGYQSTLDTEFAPLILEYLDVSDQVMTISPVITTEPREVVEWDYDSETGEITEVTKTIDMAIIKTDPAAVSIRFSGLYDFTTKLYNCANLFDIGEVTNACNVTAPVFETRVTSLSTNYTELADGWFDLNGTTEFRLLPDMIFKRLDGNDFFFEGANQIEYRKPLVATFDLMTCFDNPTTFCVFYQYPVMDYNNAWYLEIYVSGSFTISGNCITDDCTGDQYCYYTSSHQAIPLSQAVGDKSISLVTGDCSAYYKLNDGPEVPVISMGYPINDDYRLVWDQATCAFIVTCLSVGTLPCPCIDCEPQPDGRSVRLFTTSTNGICTSGGYKAQYDTVSACQSGWEFGLGVYPDVPVVFPPEEPVASPSTVDHVYFVGLDMYIALPTLVGFTYYVWIGNLSYGVELKDVEDGATGSSKTVNILPYIYLDTFKFPYEYVKSTGLDWSLWWDTDIWSDDSIRILCYDDEALGALPCYGWEEPPCEQNWPPASFCDDPDYGKTEAELLMAGITEAGGIFDFKIELAELTSRLPSEWTAGYDWGRSCGWTYAQISRPYAEIDLIVTPENTSIMDEEVECMDDIKIKYFFTNASLKFVKQPLAAWGSYQAGYDEYVDAVNLLVSEDAEAYAYFYNIYEGT